MQVAVLGTGTVGRTLAGKLAELGHDVSIGTRDPQQTLARSEPGAGGTAPFAQWQAEHPEVGLQPYAEVARDAELLVNATAGAGSLDALHACGTLTGVLLDVSNPLDFSQGFPPTLTVANTDSVAEQIQRAFPATRVVKALNTMTAGVMVQPSLVPGEHDVFVAGDDAAAKQTVVDLLQSFGWPAARVRDLGPLRAARGMEMYVTFWLSLMQSLGTPAFNIHVVTQ